MRKHGLKSKNTSEKYCQIAILFLRHFCPVLVSINYTVEDNLRFPFTVRQLEFDKSKAITALKNVNLGEDFLTQGITELSGGEKQRVALIRNLLFEPQVLLLDEVSAGLDAETKAIVNQLLTDYHISGKTIIEVTHDQSEIDGAKHILRMKDGRMQA